VGQVTVFLPNALSEKPCFGNEAVAAAAPSPLSVLLPVLPALL